MDKLWRVLVAVAVCMLLYGCAKDSPVTGTREQQDTAIQEYLKEQGASLDTIGRDKVTPGFYYYRLVNGAGVPNPSYVVSFYYTVKNLEGTTVFSHTQNDGPPLKALRNTSAIYPSGIDDALQLMKTGDRWVFILPAHRGYADIPVADKLPPNSIAIAELSVVAEESVGKIGQNERKAIVTFANEYKKTNLPDTVFYTPEGVAVIKTKRDKLAAPVHKGAKVELDWTASVLNGPEIGGKAGLQLTIGNGEVFEGFDTGLLQLSNGESAILIIPSDLAYGPGAQSVPHTIFDLLVKKEIVPQYAAQVPPFSIIMLKINSLKF